MPITRSARPVAAASLVIEIDEVLLAKIASAGVASSKRLKIASFTSRFSLAASIAMSTSSGAQSRYGVMRRSAASLSSRVSLPFSTARSRFLTIVRRPRSTNSLERSLR